MSSTDVQSRALRGLATFVFLAGSFAPTSAQFQPYVGDGFVTGLGDGTPASAAAFFRGGSDGALDLACVDAAGILTIHEHFTEHASTVEIGGIDACAVTQGTTDRLFGLSAGGLVEVVRSSGWSVEPISTVAIASATVLRATQRPGGARLLVIDQAGARASVLAPENGLGVLAQVSAAGGDGIFHDLAVLDWNGDGTEDLAVVSSAGLRIYGSGGGLMMSLPGAPNGAFLDVLNAADTQWGHDLLVYQYRQTPTSATALLFLNAFHSEVLYTDMLKLGGVAFADVDDSPRLELVLPRGDQRSAVMFKQAATASEGAAIFYFDGSETNLIDLSLEDSTPPANPPVTAVADVDGDGDEDVLFADDRGLGLVLVSGWFDADELRAVPLNPWSAPYLVPATDGYVVDYYLELDVPAGASEVEVEVWFQPDPEDPSLEPAPVYTAAIPSATPEQAITFATDTDGGVYHLLYRPVSAAGDPYPVWVEAWSPDPVVQAELASLQPFVYAWAEEAGEGLGGTVRRPKVDPGGGTGGATIGD